jgi:CheY-like chemotaxis protein
VKTILVVDDEVGSAEVLGLILEEEGYRVFGAVNGRVGLDKAREVFPDLVIVDYMMPVMDGAGFVREMRRDPRLAHTKVVINSGLPEVAVREQFADYDAFLRKPYVVDVLLAMLTELLDEPDGDASVRHKPGLEAE